MSDLTHLFKVDQKVKCEFDGKLHSGTVKETYADTLGIFETYIPMSVKASEISAEGISIYAHCPNSKVAKAYEALTQEVLAK